ncbi:MAG: lipopolysaccharide biosynthesis protein [Tenuifilaceae bacterium]
MTVNISKYFKNDFIRNVFTLFTGNALATSITLVSIPILTRLYTPEEFGAVALFIGMINVFSVASNGRYDMAIVLPKRNGQAFHLLIGSIIIALIFSLISFLIVIIFNNKLTGLFDSTIYKRIIWFLPLCVFLVGSHKSLYYWFNRTRSFKLMGSNRIVQSAGQNGVRLFRDIFSNGHWGLAIGYIVGEFLAWVMFTIQIFRKEFWRFKYLSLKTTLKSIKEYSNFPLFLMPMGVLNSFSVYLLVFALSLVTTSAMVGHYERAWRVINFPLSLISSSFGSVFYEKMNRTNNRKRLYLLSYFGNLGIAILILSPIAFWGEQIFSFVLGDDWYIAGKIARIILPLTIFSFATECVSTVFSIIKKNQLLLIWQIVYLAVVLGWIIFANNFDVYFLLTIYSVGGAILYAILAFIGFYKIHNDKEVTFLTKLYNSE